MQLDITNSERRVSHLRGAVLMALAALATPAAAQDAQRLPEVQVRGTRDAGSTIQLDGEASTGSRLGVTIRETPASVEVINKDAMRERGDRTVVETVEKAAGFSGGFTGGTPGLFSVRGFTNNSVTFLYNGVPIPGGTGMSSRIIDGANYDRVEIIRGPASVLHGDGSIGAAVNFISREPTKVRAPVEVDYALGSFDSHRFHLGTGGPVKEGVAYYRFDASTNHFGSTVKGFRTNLDRFTGSLLFTPTSTLDLSLEFDKLSDKSRDFYWGTPLVGGRPDASLRRVNYNNLTDNRFESDTTWLRANLAWRPNAAWELKNYAYAYDSFRDWRNVENYAFNAGAVPSVTRSSFGDLDHDHRVVGDRLEALYKGKLFGLDNRVSFGADVNHTRFTTKRNGFPGTQNVDPFNPPEVSFNSVTAVNKTLARDVSIKQRSFFFEDQLSLTKALKLAVGARQDRLDVEWIYFDQAGAPRERKTHTPVSYRGGLVWDVTPGFTVYGSYSTATENGGTLLLLNRNQSQLGLTRGKQWESGVKHAFWAGKGEWTAAVYDIEKRNVFVPDPANPANRIPVGKQSSNGLEGSIGVRPTDQWRIEANFASVHARFDEFREGTPAVSRNGNRPPFVPKFVANLGVRYKPYAGWELGAWMRHVGAVYTDNANTTQIASYNTLDLAANYQLNKTLNLGVRVRNATDKFYATWAYRTQQFQFAEPRTYELNLRAQF